MEWIGLLTLILFSYILHLTQAQKAYNKGAMSVLDANQLVRDPRVQFYTTFVGLIIFLAGVVFLIIGVGLWTPLYAVFGIVAGSFIRRITGNPLLGDWHH